MEQYYKDLAEKYKLALFAIVRNSKVCPKGIELGKSMDEINVMSIEVVREILEMCDFESLKRMWDAAEAKMTKKAELPEK